MESGVVLGHVGGYLNGAEIGEHLGEILFPGTILDDKLQIQQAGIDLTLARVFGGPLHSVLPFDQGGWLCLKQGSYWVEFNEIPVPRDRFFEFHLWPRSTLFRIGAALAIGLSKVADVADGVLGAHLLVLNPHGIRIQRNARVCQALIWSWEMVFTTPHQRLGNSEPLTVSEIYRYDSEGILGVEERGVETAKIESGQVQLGTKEGYQVRLTEVVAVANDELGVSQADKPAVCSERYHYQTTPVWDPNRLQHFLNIMGAIADPGYNGQLSACIQSPLPYVVKQGNALLSLTKHQITPVATDSLYDGKYQGTGIDEPSAETVHWHGPGWVSHVD